YAPSKLHDPLIRDLMSRTECYRDPSLDAVYPQQWPAAAELHLKDGTVVSTRVDFATGEPENPVSRPALVDKFISLTRESIADPARAAQQILALESEPHVQGLGAIARGAVDSH